MQVHSQRIATEPDAVHRRLIMSDLHLGHPSVDKRHIVSDIEHARRLKCPVLLNGDVFDGIQKLDKRYAQSQLSPEVRGHDDLTRGLVDLAAKLLEPYADLIDVIGVGNHEESYTRACSTDLVGLLVDRLNATLKAQGSEHKIRHGGKAGYIRTRFEFRTKDGAKCGSVKHDLLYMHGAGGDSPKTKGQGKATDKLAWYDYDCLTFGHHHNKTSAEDAFIYLSSSGRLRQRTRIFVQTGSYLWNYKRTDQTSPLDYTYAESAHSAPKPLGGKVLILRPTRESVGSSRVTEWRVVQDSIRPELA